MADPGGNRPTLTQPDATAVSRHKLYEADYCTLGYDGQLFGTQHVVEYQEETRSHKALTYDHSGATGTWTPSELPPGQTLRQPDGDPGHGAPLFKKLDESLVEECARLGE